MEHFRIIEVIKVELEDILLELHFNLEKDGERKSFKLAITDDAETISFDNQAVWVTDSELKTGLFSATKIEEGVDELGKLINNKIHKIQYGIGTLLNSEQKALYYFKLETTGNEFLFFNNGDNGYYTFHNISEILEHDIYGFEWYDYCNLGMEL